MRNATETILLSRYINNRDVRSFLPASTRGRARQPTVERLYLLFMSMPDSKRFNPKTETS